MAPTPILGLVDRVLDGRLADILRAYRAEGASIEGCARRLASEHDIDVTGETVRKWMVELGVPTDRSSADPAA